MSTTSLRYLGKTFGVTGFTLILLVFFLSPFAFMVFTSLKTPEQITILGAPIWPAQAATYEYNGEELEAFTVPMNTCVGSETDNSEQPLVMIKKGTRESRSG